MSGRMNFRVNSSEMTVIKRKAKIAKVSLSAYLRSSALSHGIGVLTEDEGSVLRAAVRQLQGACINLNQIATSINRRSERLPNTDTLVEIQAQLREFSDLMATMRRLLMR